MGIRVSDSLSTLNRTTDAAPSRVFTVCSCPGAVSTRALLVWPRMIATWASTVAADASYSALDAQHILSREFAMHLDQLAVRQRDAGLKRAL